MAQLWAPGSVTKMLERTRRINSVVEGEVCGMIDGQYKLSSAQAQAI